MISKNDWIALLAILLLAVAATAQEEQNRPLPEEAEEPLEEAVRDVEDMIVSATRLEESLFETAASANRVEASRIAVEQGASTFPDTLRFVPGVSVQKTGPGLGSPFIRGFTGFRNVLTIDGIRLNNSVFRDGPNQYWATIDPLSVDHIEVVKGPGSVLYGSDAAGGTVAVFTEGGDLGREGEGWKIGGRAYYRFNLAELSHTARGSVNGSYDGKIGFNFGGTYQSFGDTNPGGELGRVEGLSYDFWAADGKIAFAPTDNLRFELLTQVTRANEVPRHHSTDNAVSFEGTNVGTDRRRDFDQERELVILTTEIFDTAFFERLEIKAAWHSQDERQDRVRANGRNDVSGFDVDTWALTTQFESDTEIGTLVYGFDVYYDVVDSFRTRFEPATGVFTEFVQGPVGDDSDYLTLGIFLEDRIDLDWGVLTFGGRYTHIEANADEVVDPVTGVTGSVDASYDIGAGNISLLGRVTDWMNAYGSARLGFRAPNLSDLTRFSSARSNEIEVPSPDLEPEFFLGFEVGFNFEWDRVRAHAAFFHTFLFDTIVRSPTGQVIGGEFAVTKDNVGDGFTQGVELSIEWDIIEDELTFYAWGTWFNGEVDVFPTSAPTISREPITRLVPLQGRAGLIWRPTFLDGLRIELDALFASEADRLSTRDQRDSQRIPPNGTPGYAILNLRFAYEFLPGKVAFLNFENLTDKNFRVHGSGSQEPGFSVVVGFDMRF